MTDKICPECEAENPASEEICIQCGFPLEDVAAEPIPTSETCPSCGKSVSADTKFCDGCGYNLQAPPPPPPIPDTPAPPADPPPIAPTLDLDVHLSDSAEESVDTASTDENVDADRELKFSAVEGLRVGKEYVIYKAEMAVGRIDKEDGVFPDIDLEDQDDGYVSRRHATVRLSAGKVTVEDHGGENGTTVDNNPILPHKPYPVAVGQVVRIGKVSLMLKEHKTR